MRKFAIAGAAVAALMGSQASAASFVAFSGTLPGGTSQLVSKFDASFGNLYAVVISGALSVTNAFQRFENRDDASATLTATSSALLDLNITGLTGVSQSPPSFTPTPTTSAIGDIADLDVTFTNNFNATAYDGTTDYAGSSGASYDNLNGSDPYSITLNDGDTLSGISGSTFYTSDAFDNFIGTGNLTFSFARTGSSTVTGSNTIDSSLSTPRSTTMTVTYYYTTDAPEVPLPAALPLLGGGLALMGFVARRRRG